MSAAFDISIPLSQNLGKGDRGVYVVEGKKSYVFSLISNWNRAFLSIMKAVNHSWISIYD